MGDSLREQLKPYAQVINEAWVEYVERRKIILKQAEVDLELQSLNCLCVPGRVMLVVDCVNAFTFEEEDFS